MCHYHPTQKSQGVVLKDHQVQRIQSKHKWFLLYTSLSLLTYQCFVLCQSITEGIQCPAWNLTEATETPQALQHHPRTPWVLKPSLTDRVCAAAPMSC